MTEKEYDIAIIGGGINGAAVARDASLRGLSTILFEKHDFACGTSSKSSKLIHGGLRYLEQFRFNLVRDSLHERSILLENAPHQVKLIPFVFPVYALDKRPLWMIKTGLYIYDLLSPKGNPKHENLNSEKISQLFPGINREGLKGGCLYYDAQMLDNRLVFSNILSAKKSGANILNYSEVTGLYKNEGKINGVYVLNSKDGSQCLYNAKAFINATGPWSNHMLAIDQPSPIYGVYPTKGVHLVIPQICPSHALTLAAPQDGRVFFLIPWNGYSLLGTTDTPFPFNPNQVSVTDEDIDYLLKAALHYFPGSGLGPDSVLASFAGLRPLVKNHAGNASQMNRKHNIHVSSSGLISILGGKFTTYRHMAEEVVDKAVEYLGKQVKTTPCSTQHTPLFELTDRKWMVASEAELLSLALEYGISSSQLKHIITNYGSAFWEILSIIKKNPADAGQICKYHPHIFAEITYAITHEQANSLEDWFQRRTQIAFLPCRGLQCAEQTASKFKELLQWSDEKMRNEINSYRSKVI